MNGSATLAVGILFAGFAVTYVWRALGVFMVARFGAESEWLLWVRSVATALVAALVMRIATLPPGLLAETHAVSRFGALAVGVAAFFTLGRRVEPATLIAVAFFLLSELVIGGLAG